MVRRIQAPPTPVTYPAPPAELVDPAGLTGPQFSRRRREWLTANGIPREDECRVVPYRRPGIVETASTGSIEGVA